MKRIVFAVLMLASCLMLSACGLMMTSCGLAMASWPCDYEFLNPVEEISEVSIIQITQSETDFEQTEIAKIEDVEAFLADFDKLYCSQCFVASPESISEDYKDVVVFRITYTDGSYELINWHGQSKYTEERGFNYYAGLRYFEEDEFNTLLEKYLQQ